MTTRILMYIRPYSIDIFTRATNLAFANPCVTTISEYPKVADKWIGEFVYSKEYDKSVISQDTLFDVIERDRALREMDPDRAMRIVNRFWAGCISLFESHRFDFLITMTIDCYCVDVLVRVAQSFGVPVISPIATFLKGDYAKFTLRGERIDLPRTVGDAEVNAIHDRLVQKTFIPKTETKNIKRTVKDIRSFYWRRVAIEAIYHPIRRVLDRDQDNPRWNTTLVLGNKMSKYYSADYDSYFTSIEEIDFANNVVAYMPLHLVPEATTDYFCKSIAHEGYENYVLRVAREKDDDVLLVIKEHPAMYGKRPLSFYHRLRELKNVVVVHPLQSSNELLEHVDLVVVDNGTVGVEALMRGKRVLSLESNYYSDLHPNISEASVITISEASKTICDYDNHLFVRDLLLGMFPSDFCDEGAGMKSIDVEKLADGFKLFIEAL